MMKFRTIKDAVKTLLTNSAASRYTVAGSQRQSKSADEVIDNSRLVQVYYFRGMFPKRGGGVSGSTKDHEITIKIVFTVSKAAKGDIAVLNNQSSTAAQLQSAIAGITYASDLADESLDELFDIVYQVLMNAENAELGLANDIVSSRWITDFQKDEPVPRGELLVLTGSCDLTCKASEDVSGETPIDGNEIDTDLEILDDLGNNAGVSVDPVIP